MERSASRLRAGRSTTQRAWDDLLSPLDDLPVRRPSKFAAAQDKLALLRAEEELSHQRRMWALEAEREELKLDRLRSALRHQTHMEFQEEVRGAIRILWLLVLLALLVAAMVLALLLGDPGSIEPFKLLWGLR